DTLINKTKISFADGVSEPAGQNRKNPRVISNTIFAQYGDMPNSHNLSDFVFAWGQIVDHDVAFVRDTDENFDIPVPRYDPWMDPFGTGSIVIPLHRSVFREGTGTSAKNPRRFENSITGYLDGSVLYGSDDHTASWLRSY
ncbi:peroxidase family protein, partial [Arthrospira platensis SPKY1]|nr:peroxidase family protein [Arthrospira platensis SPKY1]